MVRALAAPSFLMKAETLIMTCGISSPFGLLSPATRQIIHVLRILPPLYSEPRAFTSDLADRLRALYAQ